MAIIHGYNFSGIYQHTTFAPTAFDLTTRNNEVTIATDLPVADITGFGSAAKSFVAGQYTWTVDLRGWYDGGLGTTDIDGVLGSASINTTAGSLSLCPQGSTTGYSFYKGSAFCTAYSRASGLGGGVGITARFQGTGPLTRALCA